MSDEKPGGEPEQRVTLAQARYQKARAWMLMHPEMSKSQVSKALGVSDATVARARRDLVEEGLFPKARNAPAPTPVPKFLPAVVREPVPVPPVAAAPEPPPRPQAAPAKLTDHAGMKKLADAAPGGADIAAFADLAAMIDEAIESGDHEAIQKKLLKQCLMFAMRPDLHPDTRMSASQMYNKLRDMAKAKDLGPGKPKNFAAGLTRLTELHAAVGIEMTFQAALAAFGPEAILASLRALFDVKEAQDDEAPSNEPAQAPGPAQAVEPAVAAPPPAEAAGAPHDDAQGSGNPWGNGG